MKWGDETPSLPSPQGGGRLNREGDETPCLPPDGEEERGPTRKAEGVWMETADHRRAGADSGCVWLEPARGHGHLPGDQRYRATGAWRRHLCRHVPGRSGGRGDRQSAEPDPRGLPVEGSDDPADVRLC